MAVVRQGPPPVTGASNAGVEGTSRIVGDSWLSMDWWRAGPVNNNCDKAPCTYGDASFNLYLSQPATCTTKTEQNSVRSFKSEAELAVDVLYYWS